MVLTSGCVSSKSFGVISSFGNESLNVVVFTSAILSKRNNISQTAVCDLKPKSWKFENVFEILSYSLPATL